MIGYVLKRQEYGDTWVFLGTSPKEVSEGLRNELEGENGLYFDERDTFIIEPIEITQEEMGIKA